MDEIPEKVKFIEKKCEIKQDFGETSNIVLQHDVPISEDYSVEQIPVPKQRIHDVTGKTVMGLDMPGFLQVKISFKFNGGPKSRKFLIHEETTIAEVLVYIRKFLDGYKSRASSYFVFSKGDILTNTKMLLEIWQKYHKPEKSRVKLIVMVENTFGYL